MDVVGGVVVGGIVGGLIWVVGQLADSEEVEVEVRGNGSKEGGSVL